MILSAPFRERNPRLRAVGGLIGIGLLALLIALFRVQVMHAERYGDREEAQSLRRIRIPSARGEIVDRNGVVLANNRPSYDVVIYLDQLGRVSKQQDIVTVANASLGALSRALHIPVTLADQDVRVHYLRRRPLPLSVWRDLRPERVAAFAENASNLPGVDLIVTPVREYPQGQIAAHVLGYCGKAESSERAEEEEVEHFYYYQPDTVGKQGVERACDQVLQGAPGGRTIRVNPRGTMVGVVGDKPNARGNRVVLTIDARMQRIVEAALAEAPMPAGKDLLAAAVLLDVNTGEILAMASRPAFDPNLFNPGASADAIRALFTDPRSPTLNRAIGGRYAPGSTFKPVTLLAGLEANSISPRDSVVCTGSLQIGNWPRPFGCWNRRGHGTVDMMEAMKQSCDVWFYQKAMATGVNPITRTATELGLGQPTGLDVGRDLGGLVPTPTWKRMQRGLPWYDGDTAQLGIGQSFLLVTPLQMACLAAALGNGGSLWRPFVVKRIETPHGEVAHVTKTELRSRLSASSQHIQTVRETMLAAVQSADGTGHRAAVRGLRIAGKTGTAEFETPHGRVHRVWFIGYAPYENPQVALSVMIEEGESGGHTAAPVASKIFAGVFGKKVERVAGGGGD